MYVCMYVLKYTHIIALDTLSIEGNSWRFSAPSINSPIFLIIFKRTCIYIYSMYCDFITSPFF